MDNTSGTNKRPRMDDPQEFALIKSIYFFNDTAYREEVEPLERLERMQSKHRNLNRNSR